MVRLMPKDVGFYTDMEADAQNLLEAARALDSMATAYDRLDERVAEIRALEHQGDVLDATIQKRISDSFILPYDREDVHELVVRMDDVVDGIQEAAETFVIYNVQTPTDETRRLTAILAAAASQLLEAVKRLDGLQGIGIHLAEVHQLENEADSVTRGAIARLFKEHADALEVIKHMHLYEELEEAIDAVEDAAEVIERIATKNA